MRRQPKMFRRKYTKKSEIARKKAQSRWKNSDRNANALQSHSEGNAIKETVENPNNPLVVFETPKSQFFLIFEIY